MFTLTTFHVVRSGPKRRKSLTAKGHLFLEVAPQETYVQHSGCPTPNLKQAPG